MKDAHIDLGVAAGRLEGMRQNEAQAKEHLRRRPELETKVEAIDERLANDLRVRTRIQRLERPDAILNTLGDRPAPGPAARKWDTAAGRLAEYQAAFDITDGLGPRPRFLDRNAYTENRAFVEESIEHVRPPRVIEREGPSLGLSM